MTARAIPALAPVLRLAWVLMLPERLSWLDEHRPAPWTTADPG